MWKKALMPVGLLLALTIVLVGAMYGCLETGWDEKILGPEQHHH